MVALDCNSSAKCVVVQSFKCKDYGQESLSMFEYLCSVSVNALDMYMTGLDSCSMTAPSPFFEASHWIVCFLVLSK